MKAVQKRDESAKAGQIAGKRAMEPKSPIGSHRRDERVLEQTPQTASAPNFPEQLIPEQRRLLGRARGKRFKKDSLSSKSGTGTGVRNKRRVEVAPTSKISGALQANK